MKRLLAEIERRLGSWLRGRRERMCLWNARRVPHWLRYWVCVDAIARSTSGPYSATVVPELPAMEVLGRLEALR
jgi:hypothetical protein